MLCQFKYRIIVSSSLGPMTSQSYVLTGHLLWNGLQTQRVVVAPFSSSPLQHKWAHLALEVGIAVHRIHNWVSLLKAFFLQQLCSTFWLCKLARRQEASNPNSVPVSFLRLLQQKCTVSAATWSYRLDHGQLRFFLGASQGWENQMQSCSPCRKRWLHFSGQLCGSDLPGISVSTSIWGLF